MNIVKIRNEMRNGRTIFDLPLRVTFYARVSTDRDEQLNSLENQVQYYTELIQSKRSWSYVPGYIDEGISGTSTKKRDSFLRMIQDAKDGRFDFIITKEISRFSRSTLDSIQYTQELLEHDVGVLFQNDNINTLDPDSEFRLVVMAGVTPTPATPITSQTADKKRPGWHGLPPGALCALTALRLQRLLEGGEGLFFDARDIRARDPKLCGDLALRSGRAVAQTVAQGDDRPLARREHALHDLVELRVQLAGAQIVKQILLRADRVHEREGVAVLTGLNVVRQRHIRSRLPLRPKVHEDLIFYTPGSVGRQARALGGVERGNALDEPDRPDRDQILLIGSLRVVFFIQMKQKDTIFQLEMRK